MREAAGFELAFGHWPHSLSRQSTCGGASRGNVGVQGNGEGIDVDRKVRRQIDVDKIQLGLRAAEREMLREAWHKRKLYQMDVGLFHWSAGYPQQSSASLVGHGKPLMRQHRPFLGELPRSANHQ